MEGSSLMAGDRVLGCLGKATPAVPPPLPQGRLLGHSPVLRNVTNSQAPGSWRKEACSHAGTEHSPGEDKENVRFWGASVGTLQSEGAPARAKLELAVKSPHSPLLLPTGWMCLQDARDTHSPQPHICSAQVDQPQRGLCPEAKLSTRRVGGSGERSHGERACPSSCLGTFSQKDGCGRCLRSPTTE